MTALLAGGGFRRGFYGATDAPGHEPSKDPCSPDDVSASIFHQLGFPPTHQIQTRQRSPISLFRDGRVLSRIIS